MLGAFRNSLLCHWLWWRERQQSRVHKFELCCARRLRGQLAASRSGRVRGERGGGERRAECERAGGRAAAAVRRGRVLLGAHGARARAQRVRRRREPHPRPHSRVPPPAHPPLDLRLRLLDRLCVLCGAGVDVLEFERCSRLDERLVRRRGDRLLLLERRYQRTQLTLEAAVALEEKRRRPLSDTECLPGNEFSSPTARTALIRLSRVMHFISQHFGIELKYSNPNPLHTTNPFM